MLDRGLQKNDYNELEEQGLIQAFELGILTNGQAWMEMIKSRNATVDTYDEQRARDMLVIIRTQYHQLFLDLAARLRREVTP